MRLRLVSPSEARAQIARALLERTELCQRVGAISLEPHQISAAARIERAMEEFGGALLADEVGMGKTFVAAAAAQPFSSRLVVAPSALSSMWRDALSATQTKADFISFARLSRGRLDGSYDFVIVDEAHHVRNPGTRSYAQLARLVRSSRVLLLTATPIHNRRDELLAILSLFLGSRSATLTEAELGRCIVRREHADVVGPKKIPRVLPVVRREISDDPRIVEELLQLPMPVPVRDGEDGGALIVRGLIHMWASSEAALYEAIRRRIAKTDAIIASLEVGTYPSEQELRSWTYGEGTLQLGFPELLASPAIDPSTLLGRARAHTTALEQFHACHAAELFLDAQRVQILAGILAAHPGAKVVAFAQYAETISMLFRQLAKIGGVAMLTARGARIASGKLSRQETLIRFAPQALHSTRPRPAETIDVLLTTDLLSEGVNLQDARVVAHLDIPWTAARMDQRVGRLARIGSLHADVAVYLIEPPASASAVLKSEAIVRRKWTEAKRAIGWRDKAPLPRPDQAANPADSQPESVPQKNESLRRILQTWLRCEAAMSSDETTWAAVIARTAGFVATVSINDQTVLLTCLAGRILLDLDSQIAACSLCEGETTEIDASHCQSALAQIRHWFERHLAAESAGVAGSRSLRRKRLLNRIDSSIEKAPPHLRQARSMAAARARKVAMAQLSAALEGELDSLARSPLPDDEWLDAVASLKSGRSIDVATPDHDLRIHSVLLLVEAI